MRCCRPSAVWVIFVHHILLIYHVSQFPCSIVPTYIDEDEESEKSFLQSIRMSYHIMSYHVMSCHVMSCHVMSCHVMSCHVMSCHVMSCRIIWINKWDFFSNIVFNVKKDEIDEFLPALCKCHFVSCIYFYFCSYS